MNVTCGTDIVKISRIRDSIDRIGEDFINRIYTEEERIYCESKKITKYQSYAARFAAKEAVYKAMSPNKESEVSWRDIEILKEENGKPYINLHGKLKDLAVKNNVMKIEISLSHDEDYAVANAIVEKE
jgi:holo-[acyl-carrier protein] synthase